MAQMFAAFGKFGQNNKGSIQNFGIIGVTIGSEELTKFIFFFCPCDYPMNQVYGSTFIWGPAAVLLVVGYVINRRTWRLTTGMCNRTQGVGKGCKRVFHFLFIFMNISMKAILAPATWIVISFLKGDYYACAAWPAPDDPTVHAKFNLNPNVSIPLPCYFKSKPVPFDRSVPESIARDLRAYSHIIGWWFLAWAVMFGIFFVFIFRCMSKYSYEQSKYIAKYRSHEMSLFDEGLDAKAKAQAKIIVDQFFSKPRSKEEWDQIASINDKVMKSKRGRPIYSPMHKFSNKELIALELEQSSDFVASAAQKKRHFSNLISKKKAGSKLPAASQLNSGTQPPGYNGGSAAPPSASSSAPAATAVIPMVAMMRPGRAVVKPPPRQADIKEGTHATIPGPPTTEVQAELTPPAALDGSPQPHYVEDDPILEANTENRSSIVVLDPDMEEDPIKEAGIAEQAEEIRKSMQNIAADDAYEATEYGVDESSFQENESEDYDSQPLIS